MRRLMWIVAVMMVFTMFMVACGKKDAGSVMQELDQVMENLKTYKGAGKMVLHTGQEPQEFDVQVWYQKPHFYRIVLKNTKKDVTQIILRNDEGVFVLTPQLNKSFRFQSNWPDNQAQVYLYQSLINSILADKGGAFVEDNGLYVFEVTANYQNASMARQKIWLEPKSYAPKRVEVADANGNLLIGISFDQFEMGNKFEKDSFDMQRNLTSWQIQSLPTLTDLLQEGGVAQGEDSAGADTSMGQTTPVSSDPSTTQPDASTTATQPERILEPAYLPEGVALQSFKDVDLGGVPAVMTRYAGTYNFTLIQHAPQEKTVTVLPGEVVSLGFTNGILIGDELRTLTWIDEGVEFRLSTGDMPQEEMIRVASSLVYEMGK